MPVPEGVPVPAVGAELAGGVAPVAPVGTVVVVGAAVAVGELVVVGGVVVVGGIVVVVTDIVVGGVVVGTGTGDVKGSLELKTGVPEPELAVELVEDLCKGAIGIEFDNMKLWLVVLGVDDSSKTLEITKAITNTTPAISKGSLLANKAFNFGSSKDSKDGSTSVVLVWSVIMHQYLKMDCLQKLGR